jgi:hypothetical protein
VLGSDPNWVFDPEKPKIKEAPMIKLSGKYPSHLHMMANRYMIKRLLSDLYEVWRPLVGEIAHKPYEEAILGMKHEVAS